MKFIKIAAFCVALFLAATIGYAKFDSPGVFDTFIQALKSISVSPLPSVDDTYDLGSSTYEWKDIYIDGVAYLDEAHSNMTILDDADIASDNITAAQCKRGITITNDGKGGASDYNIPAGVKGMVVYVFAEEAQVMTLDLTDSDDIIVLASGAIAAGNAIDSDGNASSSVTLVCHTGDGGTAVSYWWVHSQVGVWVDGGAD